MTDIKLPDFDDMSKVSETIAELVLSKLRTDAKIKFMEAEIVKKATTDSSLFQNGKPPSVAFIEATWKFTGINNELIPLREELAKIISELEKARLKFEIYRMQVDVFRTESANTRYTNM